MVLTPELREAGNRLFLVTVRTAQRSVCDYDLVGVVGQHTAQWTQRRVRLNRSHDTNQARRVMARKLSRLILIRRSAANDANHIPPVPKRRQLRIKSRIRDKRAYFHQTQRQTAARTEVLLSRRPLQPWKDALAAAAVAAGELGAHVCSAYVADESAFELVGALPKVCSC